MSNLYFECANGISGDMAVAALIDIGADKMKLKEALKSLNLDNEFEYEIKDVFVNSIKAVDFNVIIKNKENNEDNNHHQHKLSKHHNHEHRNLENIIKIINEADLSERAKNLSKKIFEIVAQAEANVHGKNINEVHFHEIGAIDSIVDIISFSVLFDDINPKKVYFKNITEGSGSVKCTHGTLNVPVPAVCEIASKYKLPIKITDNNGEMITPTGIAIAAALYTEEKLPDVITIEKIGNGRGKRPYPNPILRIMQINE